MIAVIGGLLMMAMGGGHLEAVVTPMLADDKPLDYRLVSLITTGVVLALPGLLGVILCRWLWQGKDWAYAMCIFSASALFVYLLLLLSMKAPEPGEPIKVGSELHAATVLVGVYLLTLVAAWLALRSRRRRTAEQA